MFTGIILLDQNDRYVSDTGKLPKRPDFDKELLLGMCEGKVLICDGNSLNDLPPSLTKNEIVEVPDEPGYADMCISPNTIDKYADLLIVSRSQETMEAGKVFRMSKFKNLVKAGEIEIWVKK